MKEFFSDMKSIGANIPAILSWNAKALCHFMNKRIISLFVSEKNASRSYLCFSLPSEIPKFRLRKAKVLTSSTIRKVNEGTFPASRKRVKLFFSPFDGSSAAGKIKRMDVEHFDFTCEDTS